MILSIKYLKQQPRWDFRYFDPKYIEIEKLLHKGKYPLEPLDKFTRQIHNFGAYSLCNLLKWVEDEESILYLKINNLKEDGIDWSDILRITPEVHEQLPKSKVYPGDILYSMAGTIGLAVIAPKSLGECNSNQAIAKIRIKPNTLNSEYVVAFFNSRIGRHQSERIANGQTVLNINLGEIGKLLIPVPPRSIQDKIAQVMKDAYSDRQKKLERSESLLSEINQYIPEILGIKVDSSKDKRSFVVNSSLLSSAKRWDFDYFEPKYQDIINQIADSKWDVKHLSEIISVLTDGQHGYLKHLPDGIPLLRTTNIFENEIRLDNVRYIAPEVHAKLERSQLKQGDVLLTTIGSIGIAAVVNDSIGEANINQNLVKLTVKDNVNPYYLAYFLNSSIGRMQTERTASKSVVPIISYPRLRKILIPVPPKSIQDNIEKYMRDNLLEVKKMRSEAEAVVTAAKARVERMILGEEETNHNR